MAGQMPEQQLQKQKDEKPLVSCDDEEAGEENPQEQSNKESLISYNDNKGSEIQAKPALEPSVQQRQEREVIMINDDNVCDLDTGVNSAKTVQSIDHVFPRVYGNPNAITRHVRMRLVQSYLAERHTWTAGMQTEFRRYARKMRYTVSPTTCRISAHVICKDANKHGATWIHFWILRVMFGPIACSRQSWFADLAKQHPWMLNEADEGVVPANGGSIIQSGQAD
ncbi:hypothetical protein V8C42DRAFT_326030 [Trichoderma barbatum]